MLRNLLFTSAATLGMVIPLGMAQEAKAGDFSIRIGSGGFHVGHGHPGFYAGYHEPIRVYRPIHRHHYHVEYRDCDWGHWRRYGTYRSHSLAHEVVDYLEYRGYEARVVHH